ncbi:hypothetical protein KIPB_013612, partial [Kipferlia bialata]|eukprot:g13612.t1
MTNTSATTRKATACLFFGGVPKGYTEAQMRELIHTVIKRMYKPDIAEERLDLINSALTRIHFLRGKEDDTTAAGYLFFSDLGVARFALKLLRYQVIDASDTAVPDSLELEVMWREDDKTRRMAAQGLVAVTNLHPTVSNRMLCQAFEPLARVCSV